MEEYTLSEQIIKEIEERFPLIDLDIKELDIYTCPVDILLRKQAGEYQSD